MDISNILKHAHRDAGLTLVEDEDLVFLKQDGINKVTFCGDAVTIANIWHEAEQVVEAGKIWNNDREDKNEGMD